MKWTCKPAQPEPVAAEMMSIERAREISAQCWCDPETEMIEMDGRLAEAFAKRLVDTHAAQPAKVRMTEELERLLLQVETAEVSYRIQHGCNEAAYLLTGMCSAVRAQAAQPACSGDELAEAYEKGWKAGKLDQRPAPAVAMTEELERVLVAAEGEMYEDRYPLLGSDIAAVRAQAAEAGKVRLPKAREGISLLIWKIDNAQGAIAVEHYSGMLRSMLAELDTAEGRK